MVFVRLDAVPEEAARKNDQAGNGDRDRRSTKEEVRKGASVGCRPGRYEPGADQGTEDADQRQGSSELHPAAIAAQAVAFDQFVVDPVALWAGDEFSFLLQSMVEILSPFRNGRLLCASTADAVGRACRPRADAGQFVDVFAPAFVADHLDKPCSDRGGGERLPVVQNHRTLHC